MALPKIVQKLFSDEGKGSKLRPDIIPTTINGNSPDSEGNFTPDQTGCLPKTGGTVTGPVTIQHGYQGLTQKLSSGSIYTDHAFLDQDGNLYGNIRVTKNDKGGSNISISANGKDANGSTTWRALEVGANSDGSSPFIKFNGDAVLTNKTGLPLTGGEMTGQIVFNKSECLLNTKESNQDMRIGGGGGYSTGTVLYMFGKDSTRGQGFYLRTVNKDNQAYQLTSDGYGSLAWNGSNIITSAGGTFGGNIKFSHNNSSIGRTNTTGAIRIDGGTTYTDGAFVTVHGKDASQSGAFQVVANNGTNRIELVGKPDGTLKWNGNDVITSAGGNVKSFIMSSYVGFKLGDTDYGQIRVSGPESGRSLTIFGTTDNFNGCNLYLASSNNTNPSFTLKAGDGTLSRDLIGKPGGALTWDGKNIVRSVNGKAADASGNVAITVSDGKVSQKHGSTFTVADSGTTKTITGLTANKPVFIGFKNNSNMLSVAMMIKSGCDTNNGSMSAHTGNSTSQNQVDFFAVVPTKTSLAIAMHPSQTGVKPSVTLYVYQ